MSHFAAIRGGERLERAAGSPEPACHGTRGAQREQRNKLRQTDWFARYRRHESGERMAARPYEPAENSPLAARRLSLVRRPRACSCLAYERPN